MNRTSVTPSFWNGCRVFVTGHTGFKGSWLCLLLKLLGAEVMGYSLPPPTHPSLFEVARIDGLVETIEADVRDFPRLLHAIAAYSPHVVIHMAAQSTVLHSYENPVGTYSTNVMGTVNVFEAIRFAKRPCVVINVTTDKIYDNQMCMWGHRENDRLGGRDPYSNSKACAELVAKAYRDSFYPMEEFDRHGVGIGSVRAGNVIGGGDWTPRQLLPDIIAACSQGSKLVLRHPTALRPWQHVLDCLAGYLTLAEQLSADPMRYAGEWNFGPAESDEWTVSDMVEAISKEWGGDFTWETDHSANGYEEPVLRLDCSKVNRVLGWHPRLMLEESVRWTVRWYKGYLNKKDPRKLCHEDLCQYMALNACSDRLSLGKMRHEFLSA